MLLKTASHTVRSLEQEYEKFKDGHPLDRLEWVNSKEIDNSDLERWKYKVTYAIYDDLSILMTKDIISELGDDGPDMNEATSLDDYGGIAAWRVIEDGTRYDDALDQAIVDIIESESLNLQQFRERRERDEQREAEQNKIRDEVRHMHTPGDEDVVEVTTDPKQIEQNFPRPADWMVPMPPPETPDWGDDTPSPARDVKWDDYSKKSHRVSADIMKKLAGLASALDSRGLYTEASMIDNIIKSLPR